ncbi:MAG: hypothetical protein H7269_15100, partial [Cellulomonas sp.]|nr:hypothetical protein [Cellulomonas sp.]
MTDHPVTGAAGEGEPDPGRPAEPPKVTDKPRIDPETGALREPAAGSEEDPLAGLDFEPAGAGADLLGAKS